MDICFITKNNRTNIRVESVHGMLWLQTHFESDHWESIALNQVLLTHPNAEMLAVDASKAGLTINLVPSINFPANIQQN